MNDLYRKRNYKICTALDMTKLGIILSEMESTGDITNEEKRAFRLMGASLLYMIRNANDRIAPEYSKSCLTA